MGRDQGVTEAQLIDLARFEESDAFDETEKNVLRYAEALSRTPADVSDSLYAALESHFSEEELVELTGMIAWENFRARFNRGFDVADQGFSEGAFCAIPERSA